MQLYLSFYEAIENNISESKLRFVQERVTQREKEREIAIAIVRMNKLKKEYRTTGKRFALVISVYFSLFKIHTNI